LAVIVSACGGGGGSSDNAAQASPPVAIVGSVEGISQTGNAFQLTGWACAPGSASSISVQIYVGGPTNGGGTAIGNFPANLASPSSVTSQCAAGGSQYSYSVPLTLATLSNFGATAIYVYGVPPGAPAGPQLLSQSGNFKVPQAIWFDPRDSYTQDSAGAWVPFAMADIASVFVPDSPWPTARSHTQVMDFDVTLIQYGSDAQLQAIFSYLKANNIAFALDAEPLVGTAECGQGVEGFGAGPSTELNTYVTDLATGADTQQQVFDAVLQTPEFASENPILGPL
jgi:hypothetical protein